MEMFLLGTLFGSGLVLAFQEIRRLHANALHRAQQEAMPRPGPIIDCPLPSPHLNHNQAKCAIAWHIGHQNERIH